ncbi:alpha/beta hydrolase [Chenggangzhangella methanolivorans]|uniref:Alpha/beta fold hydrolase n=1 Tax=Chenggangzhangella methanolivorans TaxID=1437009 RepID=A0A9E6R9A9_9HYPH|nr:alpha/beta fold hydrolase [Chenggangzhangella methanolivorans]QZO00566.1 alpha/beta fold hydrolase [Chenggangzhangella methanolivorans]
METDKKTGTSRRSFVKAAGTGAIGIATLPLSTATAFAETDNVELAQSKRKVVLAEQGSFYIGGRTVTGPGKFDPSKPVIRASNEGATFYINQMYVNFQAPVRPRGLPLVFWHGGGLTGHIWESTPDGRPGFQTLFVQDRHTVYTIDQPGRGRGNIPTFNGPFGQLEEESIVNTVTANVSKERAWVRDRLGPAPGQFFENSQFPRGYEDNYFKEMGFSPSISSDEIVDAVVKLVTHIGPCVLVTHSASGVLGMRVATHAKNVRGIVAYEPATSIFPKGKVPEIPPLADKKSQIFPPFEIQESYFKKLAKIPIQFVFGDNIPKNPKSAYWFLDWWRVTRYAHSLSLEAINKLGGQASLLDLPTAGLRGNTHFPFTDRNNVQVASLLSDFLGKHGLDQNES